MSWGRWDRFRNSTTIFIADFGADHRTKNSQPVRLRLLRRESVVRIFDESRLLPLQLEPWLPDGYRIQQIDTAGSVVPGDIFSGDVIVPGRGQAGRKREEYETKPKRAQSSHKNHYPITEIVSKSCAPGIQSDTLGFEIRSGRLSSSGCTVHRRQTLCPCPSALKSTPASRCRRGEAAAAVGVLARRAWWRSPRDIHEVEELVHGGGRARSA